MNLVKLQDTKLGIEISCIHNTNNKISEREIKETIPFTSATKVKYIGITLPKETKDLYSENCKKVNKEIEDDPNSWKDIPCSWIGKINIVKMFIQPKAM